MSVKQENWTPPNNFDNLICDQQSTYTERLNVACQDKLVYNQQSYNFQQNRSRNIGKDDLNQVKEEVKQENSEPEDDWTDNENGMMQSDASELSDDSVDLYTRWMKMEAKKKPRKKRKSSVERAEIKKFIEERGFGMYM